MKLLPDLHRADAVPQWETVDPSEWNQYQRRAAETNGWDTPGNRLSLEGAIETTVGLGLIYLDKPATTVLGAALVTVGRVRDLQDGKRAEETGTKSPKGEAIDASVDTALGVFAALVMKRKKLVPAEAADELIANVGIKIGASLVAKLSGREMHTERMGKYGTALRWADVTTRIGKRAAEHFRHTGISGKLEKPSAIMTRAGVLMDRQATAGYVRDALTPKQKRSAEA